MNLQGFGPSLLEGLALTLKLSIASVALGLVFGLAGALALLSSSSFFRLIGKIYIALVRSVPELLVILLLYYGGTALLSFIFGEYIEVSAFWAGTISLATIFGAYAAETIRAAFLSVPKGQMEAGQSFGLSQWKLFSLIRFPLAFRFALPGLGNLWLVMLKETSLVSIVGLEELMRKAKIATGFTKAPFTFYFAATLLYLLVTLISSSGIKFLEKKFSLGERVAHL